MSPKPLVKNRFEKLEREGHPLPIASVKGLILAKVEGKAALLREELKQQEATRLQQIVEEEITPAAIGAAYGSIYGVPSLPKKRSKRVIQEGAAPFGHVSAQPETVTGSQFPDIELP